MQRRTRPTIRPAATPSRRAALESAKEAVKGDDGAAIRSATSELQQASHAMADALYRASSSGAQNAGSQAADDGVKDGEVVDAA